VPELPERWSAARKTELVLRLLRGEALDAVSADWRCASSTAENFHSPSKSAKGAESLGPFGFSYFSGCGGPL